MKIQVNVLFFFILSFLLLISAACSATPAPSPTATWTATAGPAATNTPRPTDLPSPTATASPAPSWTATANATATSTPTATATATPAEVDAATWQLPLVAAGETLLVVERMEGTAAGLRDGSLPSVEAGIQLMGYKALIAVAANALDERPLTGRAARFGDGLRANLRTVFGITDRWQAGELSSETVGPELAAARADAEQMLSELAEAAGLSEAQVAELLAALDEP